MAVRIHLLAVLATILLSAVVQAQWGGWGGSSAAGGGGGGWGGWSGSSAGGGGNGNGGGGDDDDDEPTPQRGWPRTTSSPQGWGWNQPPASSPPAWQPWNQPVPNQSQSPKPKQPSQQPQQPSQPRPSIITVTITGQPPKGGQPSQTPRPGQPTPPRPSDPNSRPPQSTPRPSQPTQAPISNNPPQQQPPSNTGTSRWTAPTAWGPNKTKPFGPSTTGPQTIPTTTTEKPREPVPFITVCGRTRYVEDDVSNALITGCYYKNKTTTVSKTEFPRRFTDTRFNFEPVKGPFWEFPLISNAGYVSGDPGPDRVIFSESCFLAGEITSSNAGTKGWVECKEQF